MWAVVFVAAAFQISALCGWLSPVALAIVFWYSLAKRYTHYTQAFLGLAMAVAPVGGWLAAGGRGGWTPWLLGLAIGLWVAGFDIIYACQDVAVDRAQGLRVDSRALRHRPARWRSRARCTSRRWWPWPASCWSRRSGRSTSPASALVAALLAYEQSLVSADDLSGAPKAFDLNGYVGILYLVTTAVSLYVD